MEKIIVTRHPALVEFLKEEGIEGQVVSHANEETVRGKHVFGVLPFRLAALAGRFTEVSLTIPPEFRGKELSLEDIKKFNPLLTEWFVCKAEDCLALTDEIPPENNAGEIVRLQEEGWRLVKAGL